MATNTAAFTSVDEYLLCKYRKETGLVGGEKLRDDLKSRYGSTRREIATLLWTGCTAPNMPTGGITYGDLAETFGFEDIYGADTDGDGVPDGWELYVGANPNRGNDAGQGWDADEYETDSFDEEFMRWDEAMEKFNSHDNNCYYNVRYDKSISQRI